LLRTASSPSATFRPDRVDLGLLALAILIFVVQRAVLSNTFSGILVAENGALWGLSALELRAGNPSLLHPFYPWTAVGLAHLTGEVADALILSSAFAGCLGVGLLYWGARRWGANRGIALAGALGLCASADWTFQSCFGQPELWMGCILLAGTLLLLSQLERPSFIRLFPIALLASFGTLTREHGIPFLALTAGILLIYPPRPLGGLFGLALGLGCVQFIGNWGGVPDTGPFFHQAWHQKPVDLSALHALLPSSWSDHFPQLSHARPVDISPDFLASPREGYPSTDPIREEEFLSAFRSEWLVYGPLSPLTSMRWYLIHHAIIQWDLYPLLLAGVVGALGLGASRGWRLSLAPLGVLAIILPTALVWSDRRHIVPLLPVAVFTTTLLIAQLGNLSILKVFLCRFGFGSRHQAVLGSLTAFVCAATFFASQAPIRGYAAEWARYKAEENRPLMTIGRKVRTVVTFPGARIAPFSAAQARMQPGFIALYAELPLGHQAFDPLMWGHATPAEAWRTVVLDIRGDTLPPPWERVAETAEASAWLLSPTESEARAQKLAKLPDSPPYWIPRPTDTNPPIARPAHVPPSHLRSGRPEASGPNVAGIADTPAGR
jgi:hypothetical protein